MPNLITEASERGETAYVKECIEAAVKDLEKIQIALDKTMEPR